MEERLQRFENDYIRRKRPRGSQEVSSTEPDVDDDDDGDEEDGDVSTSEDAIYEQKMEPEFDLMKSMLRASYVGGEPKPDKAKQDVKDRQEKNIEVEIATKKPRRVIDMTNAGDAKAEAEAKGGGSGSAWNEGVAVKGKEGPRFRDLGGMKEVLEELKMEVIVPLYHPQLPRMLGVSPMAGILLHGPPGCGKTKLAHAIANETGVPFYKISATEIVSGVSGISVVFAFEYFIFLPVNYHLDSGAVYCVLSNLNSLPK